MKYGYWILLAAANLWQAAVTKHTFCRITSICLVGLSVLGFCLQWQRDQEQ